jgi:hypothetical protein
VSFLGQPEYTLIVFWQGFKTSFQLRHGKLFSSLGGVYAIMEGMY